MAFTKILRTGTRLGIGGGAVVMYYQYGLWKSAEETIENYEKLKKDVNGFIDSVAVVKDVVGDIGKYTSSVVAPVTKRVGDFRNDWMSFDLGSWTCKKDGIVKPTWNKVIGFSTDFLAHSPQIIWDIGKSGYTKASDYIHSYQTISHTTDISSSSNTTLNQTTPTSDSN